MYRLGGRPGAVEALRVFLPVYIDYDNSASCDVGKRRFGGIETGRRSASRADDPLQE